MSVANDITIEVANKMLTLVMPIMSEIKEKWDLVTALILAGTNTDSVDFPTEDVQKITKSICKNLNELEELGCSLESIGEGVVDFPSVLDNEKIMLCWRLGENEILHYHKRGENISCRLLIKQVLE